eukprot:scaffold39_cov493-Prasinococcus_capsulatus_cf.AAC.3
MAGPKHAALFVAFYPVMGKAEGEDELWHGHVTAVSVAPTYRRQSLAQTLMDLLEEITEKTCADSVTL